MHSSLTRAIVSTMMIATIGNRPNDRSLVKVLRGHSWISLAMVDERLSSTEADVSLIWGERDGGFAKPNVERHVQTGIRAVVRPCPYSDVARKGYRPRVLRL
jgi:hypothetical protein